MSFAQGVPSVNTLINSSNTQVFGNTSTGTALSVQQLGSGAVMNVATSTGTSALFVNSSGQVGVGTTNPTSSGAGTLLQIYDSSSNNPTLVVDASAGSGQSRLHMKAGQGSTFRANRMDFFSNTNIIWTQITDYNQGGSNDLSFVSAGKGYASGGVLVLTQGGNVGIGTTNPSSNVAVDTAGVVRGTKGVGTNCGSVASLGTGGSVIHTFSPPNIAGHAILTVSGSLGTYLFGFVYWVSNINGANLVIISNSGITASINRIVVIFR